jgi:Mn-dependent DtxR family transcriptional regulator
MGNVTKSREDYLKVIFDLNASGNGARISDIAAKLGFSKPSVCRIAKILEGDNLVVRGGSRQLFLTAEGTKVAVAVKQKYNTIEKFLVVVMNIDEETASADACAIEHNISVKSLAAIQNYTNEGCVN